MSTPPQAQFLVIAKITKFDIHSSIAIRGFHANDGSVAITFQTLRLRQPAKSVGSRRGGDGVYGTEQTHSRGGLAFFIFSFTLCVEVIGRVPAPKG